MTFIGKLHPILPLVSAGLLGSVSSVSAATVVWNINTGAASGGNAITPGDNVIGAAPENTANSSWNNFASPQSATALVDSTGASSSVSFSMSSPGGGLNSNGRTNVGSKIFSSWMKDDGNNNPVNISFSGLSNDPTTSYSLLIYGVWQFGPEVVELSQTTGAGLTGAFLFNQPDDNATLTGFSQDTDPANVAGAFNYVRFDNLTPDSGTIGFQIYDDGGDDAPYS